MLEHFINAVIDLGYKFNTEYCNTYDMEKGIVGVDNPREVLINIFNNPQFWIDAPMIENSYEGLYYLNSTYDTWIATSPWNEENKKTKIEWVKKCYPFFDTSKILFSHHKWLLDGDVIIEDKPDTIEKCNDIGMMTICKSQPYNLDTTPTAFLYSWKDIYDVMEDIL